MQYRSVAQFLEFDFVACQPDSTVKSLATAACMGAAYWARRSLHHHLRPRSLARSRINYWGFTKTGSPKLGATSSRSDPSSISAIGTSTQTFPDVSPPG